MIPMMLTANIKRAILAAAAALALCGGLAVPAMASAPGPSAQQTAPIPLAGDGQETHG